VVERGEGAVHAEAYMPPPQRAIAPSALSRALRLAPLVVVLGGLLLMARAWMVPGGHGYVTIAKNDAAVRMQFDEVDRQLRSP
jgi:hypothetical protein